MHGGVRERGSTRPGRCCAPIWQAARPATGISHGTAPSAIASCGSPWSDPMAAPTPPRSGPRTKVPPRGRPTTERLVPFWWQARVHRLRCDGCHRTGFLKLRQLTPSLQPANLICAIAPPSGDVRGTDSLPTRQAGRRPPHRPPPGTKRSRWTRRSPARSTTHPCCSWFLLGRGPPLGRDPRRLELWVRAVREVGGTTEMPCYSVVVQASLRCCGMPASSARTSASR